MKKKIIFNYANDIMHNFVKMIKKLCSYDVTMTESFKKMYKFEDVLKYFNEMNICFLSRRRSIHKIHKDQIEINLPDNIHIENYL